MNQHLTIAYITSRKDCKLEWFLSSLKNQINSDDVISIVIIDFYMTEKAKILFSSVPGSIAVVHSAPKPCVWQGPHKLTKEDWFAASNARNTALCLAPDGWICYVDDLSVLMPGWLNAVREAVAGNYIALGAYKKVKNLVVENGEVKSYEEYPAGVDSRWGFGKDNEAVPATGGMMYGCSVAMPVEGLLTIGGWPEYVDGLSSEDYICGLALQNVGYKFKYDRRMLTLESEEHHHLEPSLKRSDYGTSPLDKSHAALNIAMSAKYFDNYYEGGMRKMREEVLSGKPFPVVNNPQHEWFTKTPLSEL